MRTVSSQGEAVFAMEDHTGYCSETGFGNLLASTKWWVDKRVPIPNHEYIRFANDGSEGPRPALRSYSDAEVRKVTRRRFTPHFGSKVSAFS